MAAVWVLAAFIVGGGIGYYVFPRAVAVAAEEEQDDVPLRRKLALYSSMRRLWADQAFWTREHMIAVVNGVPGAACGES